jgi:hypothetical protein
MLAALALLALMAAACSPAEPSAEDVAALATRVAATSTAEAADPGSQADIASAQQTATQQAAEREATQTVQDAQQAVENSATATALAPVRAELPFYGVDPQEGRPGWLHPPVRMELDGFHQYEYENEFLEVVAADFVVSADVTWDTQYGGAGCGFVLRSDGQREALDQYLVILTRAANGHVVFGVMAEGELVNGRDLYAYGHDPQFDFQNGASNQLTVVGRADQFEIYTNGVLIGTVDPTEPLPQPQLPEPPVRPADLTDLEAQARYAQELAEHREVVAGIQADFQARLNNARQADTSFERGFVALVALSQSGATTCEFNDAWLWLLDEASEPGG